MEKQLREQILEVLLATHTEASPAPAESAPLVTDNAGEGTIDNRVLSNPPLADQLSAEERARERTIQECCAAICERCSSGIPLDKNGRHTDLEKGHVGSHCYAKLMRAALGAEKEGEVNEELLGGHARANYLGAPEALHLNVVCATLVEAFGPNIFLVGSCLTKRDYRDVDVRCILDDAEYDRLFQNTMQNQQLSAFWCLVCASISEWMSKRTGLPIDFQIQKRSEANEQYPHAEHKRSALGLFAGFGGKVFSIAALGAEKLAQG